MTTATSSAPSPRTAATAMLRAGLLAGLAVGLVAAVLCLAAAGTPGLAGSVAGSVLVALASATSLLVLDRTQRLRPAVTLLVALGLYVAKTVGLLLVFMLLTASGALDVLLDRSTFGLTIIAAALTWSGAEMFAASRYREPMYVSAEWTQNGRCQSR